MPRGELPETRRGRATSRERKQRRIFVLDTNVLMHDPTAIFRFDEHDIYIPRRRACPKPRATCAR